jgi:hypothetical protein
MQNASQPAVLQLDMNYLLLIHQSITCIVVTDIIVIRLNLVAVYFIHVMQSWHDDDYCPPAPPPPHYPICPKNLNQLVMDFIKRTVHIIPVKATTYSCFLILLSDTKKPGVAVACSIWEVPILILNRILAALRCFVVFLSLYRQMLGQYHNTS